MSTTTKHKKQLWRKTVLNPCITNSGIIRDDNAMVISTVIFTYFINIYVAQIYFYNLKKGCNCHLLLQLSIFQSTKESQLTCQGHCTWCWKSHLQNSLNPSQFTDYSGCAHKQANTLFAPGNKSKPLHSILLKAMPLVTKVGAKYNHLQPVIEEKQRFITRHN